MVDFVVPMGNRCGFHVTGMMDGSTRRLLLRHVVKLHDWYVAIMRSNQDMSAKVQVSVEYMPHHTMDQDLRIGVEDHACLRLRALRDAPNWPV
ncbi:hypothetical protein QC764_0028010 [Podospora pseudoanserina]|uniref:Uncharacterized protein n=1 Tax=Podospora pseudoanserina TaxID=2609844 RepID=A0ABR0ISD6_9PEZI|nr:hypothetical protein QC764_0028010 [Podospora pseudoanserina]